MKKLLTLSIILFTGTTNLFATTWETADRGFWADSSVWVGGIVPPHASNDTFLIKHPIVIDQNLIFNSGASVLIESDGGICGHYKTNVNSNASIFSYGILELDSLHVLGGLVTFKDGQLLLTEYARIEVSGARLKIDSAGIMKVGIWFDCVLPSYAFLVDLKLNTEEVQLPSAVKVYPNPTSGILYIETDEPSTVSLYDSKGTLLLHTDDSSLKIELDISDFASGVYVVKTEGGKGSVMRRVLLK
jgi:hypothetical protein